MNMEIVKKLIWLPIVVLVVLASCCSFLFFRLYQRDVRALTGFTASYERYDKAIRDFSNSKNGDLESKADGSLIELKTKAAFRISSLIKNDKRLMDQAPVVADLSGRELESLKVYKAAIQHKDADLDGLAKEYRDLTRRRKTAYARFRELAEL